MFVQCRQYALFRRILLILFSRLLEGEKDYGVDILSRGLVCGGLVSSMWGDDGGEITGGEGGAVANGIGKMLSKRVPMNLCGGNLSCEKWGRVAMKTLFPFFRDDLLDES